MGGGHLKAAFLITRIPEYRLYAPIIDAALTHGWEVECWHDYSQLRSGLKGHQFPWVDSVPSFRGGRPVVRPYQGSSELRTWLAEMKTDAVVAWATLEAAVGPQPPSPRPLWVQQQYLLDSFYAFSPQSLLGADVLALFSRWWLEWAGDYYECGGLVPDGQTYVREVAERAVFVGHPELDAVPMIDPDEVRHRWHIPRDKPVVVLFPFPQGVGRALFWPKKIYAEPSRLKQMANIAAHRRFEYWQYVWNGWNDINVVKAIRRFCDRNGAYLLVKSRRKTPVPAYTEALADQCIYDECLYPATILDTLKIASLSIGYYSNCVFESVALGVPHLCVTFSAKDYSDGAVDGGKGSDLYFRRFYTPEEGNPFQFRGVSTTWSIPEALHQLPSRALGDFTFDEKVQGRYIRKFLTHDSGDSGARMLEAIEGALRRPRQTAAHVTHEP